MGPWAVCPRCGTVGVQRPRAVCLSRMGVPGDPPSTVCHSRGCGAVQPGFRCQLCQSHLCDPGHLTSLDLDCPICKMG